MQTAMTKLMKNLAHSVLIFAGGCDQQTFECPHELWDLELTARDLGPVILNSDMV